MKALSFLISLGFFHLSGFSQSDFYAATAWMKPVIENYKSNTDFSCNLRYNYYPTHTSGKASETQQGELKVSGMNSFHEIPGAVSVSTTEFSILVARELKQMYVKNPEAQIYQFTAEWLDSLDKVFQNVQIQPVGTGVRLSFYAPDIELIAYEKVELELDTINQTVKKISFFLRHAIDAYSGFLGEAAPRIEVEYNSYNFSPQFTPGIFASSTYFYIKDDTYLPSASYSGYQVQVLTTIP